MTHAEISKSKEGVNTSVDVELEARNVFVAWIGKEGTDATRQAVLTAIENCGNLSAKENLTKLWQKGKYYVFNYSHNNTINNEK